MKRKIKVVFDANPLSVPNKTGIGIYTWRLVSNLAKHYPDDLEFIGYYNNFMRRHRVDLVRAPNIRFKPIHLYSSKVVNMLKRAGIEIPFEALAKSRADVALFPNYISQPSLFGTPSIPVVHDLSFMDMPQHATPRNREYLSRFVGKSLRRAKCVITVSEATRRILSQKFDYPLDQIVVTHIPPDKPDHFSDGEIGSVLRKHNIRKPYLLFVGTMEPRKNVISLLNAYEHSPYLRANFSLVIAGGTGWKSRETLERMDQLKINGLKVVHTGYLPTLERNILYKEADLFVFPSHYEGFGMPILEAINYETPVCISDIDVFHEVAGNAAVYFNQNDFKDISAKLEVALQDKSVRAAIVKRGRERLKEYSWQTICNEVFEVLTG